MTRHRKPAAARRLGGTIATAALSLQAALLLQPTGAAAAASGTALVVGDAQYTGQAVLPACSQAAHGVAARLRQQGFTVNEIIDGSAVALRDALGDFAARANASSGPALIYVCAEATAVDRRLFVLPSDVDLQRPLRPETQGVVMRALLNGMAGTKGTMIAELALRPGADAAPVMAALQDGVPEGLHLALSISDGKQIGALGGRLASNGVSLDQSWDRLAAALQAAPQATPTAIALFQPPPVPAAATTPRPTPLAPQAPAVVAVAPQAAAPATPEPKPAPESQPAPEPKSEPTPDPTPAGLTVAAVTTVPAPTAPTTAPSADAAPPAPGDAGTAPTQQGNAKTARPRPAGDERTRRLQAALTRHKLYSGPLDGVTDARTIQAILSYQISIGDPPTGTLTQTEIVRLLNNW